MRFVVVEVVAVVVVVVEMFHGSAMLSLIAWPCHVVGQCGGVMIVVVVLVIGVVRVLLVVVAFA